MKTFIYTYHERERPNGVEKIVYVYRIYKNRTQPVGTMSDMFVSEFQLVMQLLEKKKALPAAVFARNPSNGCPIYGSAWALEQDRVAIVERVA